MVVRPTEEHADKRASEIKQAVSGMDARKFMMVFLRVLIHSIQATAPTPRAGQMAPKI